MHQTEILIMQWKNYFLNIKIRFYFGKKKWSTQNVRLFTNRKGDKTEIKCIYLLSYQTIEVENKSENFFF